MERVPIAHFADLSTADLAAAFLQVRDFDAVCLDKSGSKSSAGGIVLVPRNEATSAIALLRRVSRGDFVDGVRGGSCEETEIATDLTRALRGTADRSIGAAWLGILPVAVVATVVVASIVGAMIWSALQ